MSTSSLPHPYQAGRSREHLDLYRLAREQAPIATDDTLTLVAAGHPSGSSPRRYRYREPSVPRLLTELEQASSGPSAVHTSSRAHTEGPDDIPDTSTERVQWLRIPSSCVPIHRDRGTVDRSHHAKSSCFVARNIRFGSGLGSILRIEGQPKTLFPASLFSPPPNPLNGGGASSGAAAVPVGFRSRPSPCRRLAISLRV